MGREVKISETCYPGAIFPASYFDERDIKAKTQANQCAQSLTRRDRKPHVVLYKHVEPIPGSMGFDTYYTVVEKTSAEARSQTTDAGCGCALGAKPKSSFLDRVLTMFFRLFDF